MIKHGYSYFQIIKPRYFCTEQSTMSYRGRGRGGPNRGGGRGGPNRGGGRGGGGRPPGLKGKDIGMYYRQQSLQKKQEHERRNVRD